MMRSLLKKIRYQLFYNRYKNNDRYKPAVIRYKDLIIETPDSLSVLGQVKEIFFDSIYFFEPASKDNVLIYDCGANVGLASIYLKKIYPAATIKAFEADPAVAVYLKKNLAANNIGGVHVIEKAVWTNNGHISFNQEGADGGSIGDGKGTVSIECVRLKDHIAKESTIDLLKIDIEGAELAVLTDCSDVLHKVQHLFVEYHSHKNEPQRLPELLKVLTASGFRYYIETISHNKSPLVVKPLEGNFDLQLNIFAVNLNKKNGR
jgi:FkbM family methyltransferase